MNARKSSCNMFLVFLVTTLPLNYVLAAPTNISEAESYLSQFGYFQHQRDTLSTRSSQLIHVDSFQVAISKFQSFNGLDVTGELNEETRELMSMPRCGVKDVIETDIDSKENSESEPNTRSKRYVLQGSRWKIKALTYRITKYPIQMKKTEVDKELARAFAMWSDYTDLTFTATTASLPNIVIRFETGEHGDGSTFDGPGGTLAHAFFPVFGGDAHFDDTEHWTLGSNWGKNLFQIAAHEFGHSLGLSHSSVKRALMAPFYRGYEPGLELDYDDIRGIQYLYGKKSVTSTSTQATNGKTKPEDLSLAVDICKDSKIDAIFNSGDNETYAFKRDKYYRLMDEGIDDGYPKTISEGWPGLPNNIDAAFTYKTGKTYFFKGSKYWRYNGRTIDGEYPKEISEEFGGIPDNLDAALVWRGNGRIFFFKGSKFWRFDPVKRPPVKASYPKPLNNWEGVPDNVDAALQYTNGFTYFFKGDKYYRFNERTFAVDITEPPFPRPSAFWWFGCKN